LAIIGALGAVAAFYGAATALGKIGLENLADDVDDYHDDIACAIYQSDGVDGAYTALKNKVNELWSDVNATIILSMNLGPTLKAYYAGRYNEFDVAQALEDRGYDPADFDCGVCTQIGEYAHLFTFATTIEQWLNESVQYWTWLEAAGCPGGTGGGVKVTYSITNFFGLSSFQMGVAEGLSPNVQPEDSIYINKISFWYRSTASTPNGTSLRVRILQGDGSTAQYDNTFGRTYNVFTYEEVTFPSPVAINGNAWAIKLNSVSGNAFDLQIDEFYVDFDLIRG
jgi:hypothetical protein